jgi:hypothetical protein
LKDYQPGDPVPSISDRPDTQKSSPSDSPPTTRDSTSSDPPPTTQESTPSDSDPQPKTVTFSISRPSTMSHLQCQTQPSIVLDAENPERNQGIFVFKLDSVAYGGKKINVRQFVMPLNDPRDYPHTDVTWEDDGLKSFVVKKPVVPETFVGGDNGRNELLMRMMEKVTAKTMEWDGITEEEACSFSSRALENILVFSNAQQESPPSRFETRVFKLPDGETFRQDLFNNTPESIQTILTQAKITYRNKYQFYVPAVCWFIALQGRDGDLIKVKKQSKEDELKEEFDEELMEG